MIKAFLFDMDGTLANSEKYYIDNTIACFKEKGKIRPFEEIRNEIVGATMDYTYEYASKVLNVSYRKAKIIYDDYFLKHPLNYQEYLFEDSLDTIRKLKEKGYKIALCTMNTKEAIDNFLDCGFRELFDIVIKYGEGIREKPYPDIYLKALEELNISNDEAIVIEDSLSGIKAGKNANIKVIATNESKIGCDLKEADYIIDNLKELLEVYE